MYKMISLDNGNTWQTATDAMSEIIRRDIWTQVINMMDENIQQSIKGLNPYREPVMFLSKYLELADDGLVVCDPIYDKDTFINMMDDYLCDHYIDYPGYPDSIHIDPEAKYDTESKCWEGYCTFDGDNHTYVLVGYENGLVELYY